MASKSNSMLELAPPKSAKERASREQLMQAVLSIIIHKVPQTDALHNLDVQEEAVQPYLRRFKNFYSETSLRRELRKLLKIGPKRSYTDATVKRALRLHCQGHLTQKQVEEQYHIPGRTLRRYMELLDLPNPRKASLGDIAKAVRRLKIPHPGRRKKKTKPSAPRNNRKMSQTSSASKDSRNLLCDSEESSVDDEGFEIYLRQVRSRQQCWKKIKEDFEDGRMQGATGKETLAAKLAAIRQELFFGRLTTFPNKEQMFIAALLLYGADDVREGLRALLKRAPLDALWSLEEEEGDPLEEYVGMGNSQQFYRWRERQDKRELDLLKFRLRQLASRTHEKPAYREPFSPMNGLPRYLEITAHNIANTLRNSGELAKVVQRHIQTNQILHWREFALDTEGACCQVYCQKEDRNQPFKTMKGKAMASQWASVHILSSGEGQTPITPFIVHHLTEHEDDTTTALRKGLSDSYEVHHSYSTDDDHPEELADLFLAKHIVKQLQRQPSCGQKTPIFLFLDGHCPYVSEEFAQYLCERDVWVYFQHSCDNDCADKDKNLINVLGAAYAESVTYHKQSESFAFDTRHLINTSFVRAWRQIEEREET